MARTTGAAGHTTAPRRSHDWTALEREFVSGGSDDLKAFAAAHGLTREAVSRRASAADWRGKRAEWRAKVEAGARERLADAAIATEAEIDGRAHRAAMALVGKLVQMVESVAEPQSAKALAQAMAETHRLARLTAHLPAEPAPTPTSDDDGVIRIRRRNDRGEVVEVTVGADGNRSHRPDADADAMGVPAGPDAHPGNDRGAGVG